MNTLLEMFKMHLCVLVRMHHTLARATDPVSRVRLGSLMQQGARASISRLEMPVDCLLMLAMYSFCFRCPQLLSNYARNEKIKIYVYHIFFLSVSNFPLLNELRTGVTRTKEEKRNERVKTEEFLRLYVIEVRIGATEAASAGRQ